MGEKVKVFITEAPQEHIVKFKDIMCDHPEFEVCHHDDKSNRAVKVLSDALLVKRISTILITVGIPPHIKGYNFLREAVKMAIQKPDIINSVTRELYPSIAQEHTTTPSKVERAIRHAIEVGWARGRIENINNIFGIKVYGQNDRPTNGEFIALLADKLMIDSLAE